MLCACMQAPQVAKQCHVPTLCVQPIHQPLAVGSNTLHVFHAEWCLILAECSVIHAGYMSPHIMSTVTKVYRLGLYTNTEGRAIRG